jgi:hypothetical protein
MPRKAPLDYELDELFVAHQDYILRTEPEPMIEDRIDWSEVKAVAVSMLLISFITIGAVMGVCALYERSAHHQSIVCQEGC